MTTQKFNIDLQDNLRNFIFPIVELEPNTSNNELIITGILGTAFFIGFRKYFLTAKHIFETTKDISIISGLFYDKNNRGIGARIALNDENKPIYEYHPTEDIAIGRLSIEDEYEIKPLIRLFEDTRSLGQDFSMIGYPGDLYKDNMEIKNLSGIVMSSARYVIYKGHVRRYVNYPISPFNNKEGLLELSSCGGAGCSGAPVVNRNGRDNYYELFGIYLGEKQTETASGLSMPVGYALDATMIRNWEPKILQPLTPSIQDESIGFKKK